MNRVLDVIKKVCFSILIFISIIFFLMILALLSAKVMAVADVNVSVNPGLIEKEVKLFYGNEEFLTGRNQDAPRMLEYRKYITAGETDFGTAVVRELYNSPGKGLISLIPPSVILLGVEIDSGRAAVNFSSEKMNGGSLQEAMLMEQIVHTLAKACNAEEVIFLVDGKPAETLMGHLDISLPIYTKEHLLE